MFLYARPLARRPAADRRKRPPGRGILGTCAREVVTSRGEWWWQRHMPGRCLRLDAGNAGTRRPGEWASLSLYIYPTDLSTRVPLLPGARLYVQSSCFRSCWNFVPSFERKMAIDPTETERAGGAPDGRSAEKMSMQNRYSISLYCHRVFSLHRERTQSS